MAASSKPPWILPRGVLHVSQRCSFVERERHETVAQGVGVKVGDADLLAHPLDQLAGVLVRQALLGRGDEQSGPLVRAPLARSTACATAAFSGATAAFVVWPLPLSLSTRWRPCSPRSSMSAPTASETLRPS